MCFLMNLSLCIRIHIQSESILGASDNGEKINVWSTNKFSNEFQYNSFENLLELQTLFFSPIIKNVYICWNNCLRKDFLTQSLHLQKTSFKNLFNRSLIYFHFYFNPDILLNLSWELCYPRLSILRSCLILSFTEMS